MRDALAPGVVVRLAVACILQPLHLPAVPHQDHRGTASEAMHVLDALLHHGDEVTVRRHHTDGGGDTEHVFALCSLLGFQFAPRIPNLAKRRLYGFGKPAEYPTLAP